MSVSHLHSVVSRPALRILLFEAYSNDPRDEPISPLGDYGYTTMDRVIPSALAVLRVAAHIELDPERALDWYRHTRISELGFLTAEQLVEMGRASVVIDFLQSIRCGQRG